MKHHKKHLEIAPHYQVYKHDEKLYTACQYKLALEFNDFAKARAIERYARVKFQYNKRDLERLGNYLIFDADMIEGN